MQGLPNGNQDFQARDIFERFNQYFLLFFALCCMLSSVFVQEFFRSIGQFRLGISVAPIVGIILPVFLLARRFDTGLKVQLRVGRIRLATGIHVTLAALAMVVIVDQIYILSQRFMPEPEGYFEELKALKPVGIWPTILTFVGLCVFVPLSEEIIFRGIIQRVFARNMGPVLAVILAGVFFGVVHLNPQLLLSMITFGVFVGFIFLVTSNLTYAMLAHAVLNTVAFVQLIAAPLDDTRTAPFYLKNWWYLPLALAVVGLLLRRMKTGATLPASTPIETQDDSETR
jgi:membrane protease YdiL (CAAX protease family)